MDREAWWAAVHGVARSRTQLSDFTFTFHFCASEKEMATHSSVLVWRIPGKGEPGGLPSVGLHRVGHDGSNLAAAAVPQWGIKPTPLERNHVILTIGPPGKSLTGFLYNFFFFRKYFWKNISVFQIASLPQLRDLLFSIHRAIYWGPYAGLQADILYVFSVNGWISHKVSPRGVVRRTVQRARSLTFRSSSLSWGESAINITGWSKPDCDNRP